MNDAGTADVTLTLNGREVTVRVPNDEHLLTTLRRDFGITSVRGTCGIGVCGTCTVLLDGSVASSCLMLTRQAAGHSITTSEGVAEAGESLSDVQQAFLDNGAYQCSFCIPGMVLAVHGALAERPGRSVSEVREYLAGNLCRCGTYPQVLEAVRQVVDERRATRARNEAVGARSSRQPGTPAAPFPEPMR